MEARLHEPTSATMPAGRYIVGDPCYAVPDDRWMAWLAAADPDVFGPDASRRLGMARILLAEIDGHTVLGIGTKYGGGSYRDQLGNEYPVDAGLIGLVPEAYGAKEQRKYDAANRSPVIEFSAPFTVEYDEDANGLIRLGHIRIETDPEDWGD